MGEKQTMKNKEDYLFIKKKLVIINIPNYQIVYGFLIEENDDKKYIIVEKPCVMNTNGLTFANFSDLMNTIIDYLPLVMSEKSHNNQIYRMQLASVITKKITDVLQIYPMISVPLDNDEEETRTVKIHTENSIVMKPYEIAKNINNEMILESYEKIANTINELYDNEKLLEFHKKITEFEKENAPNIN